MGVRGLRSFMDSNNYKMTRLHKLANCRVIIDGSNLLFYLYNLSSQTNFDYKYGGNYVNYSATIKRFFKALKKANVEPIVVFDGGYCKNRHKMATVFNRIKTRLTNVKNAFIFGFASGLILPILAPNVLKDILLELKITFVQSLFEADGDIAAIANYLRGPVISNDSDFYIYDLNSGFILLDSIDFENIRKFQEPQNSTKYYLDSKIFYIENFLCHFQGLKKEILPVFSTLMGNDYVPSSVFQNIFNALPALIEKRNLKNLNVSKRHHNMIRLLDWLREKSVEEAMDFLINFLKTSERNSATQLIFSTIRYFNSIFHLPFLLNYIPQALVETKLPKPLKVCDLPDWFIDLFCSGLIDSSLMNIIVLKKLILLPQVDDLNLPSSYSSSITLQKFLLSLLCFENKEMTIIVYDRVLQSYLNNFLTIASHHISIDTVIKLNDDQKRKILYNCLNIKDNQFNEARDLIKNIIKSEVEEEFVLILFLVKHWLNTSKVFLESFAGLLSVICFYYFVVNFKQVECFLDEQEREQVIKDFKKFQAQIIFNNSNTFKPLIVHHFSQFQSIIIFFTRIQSIIKCSLKSIHVHNYLDGISLYNLTTDLIRRVHPILYLNTLFGRQTLITKLFNFLIDFLQPNPQLMRWNDTYKQIKKSDTFEINSLMEELEKLF